MELVSFYSLMAHHDFPSLFCCTSHHTTEDLATETKHPATLPFRSWFPVLDSKVRNIFMSCLKMHWLCIKTCRFKKKKNSAMVGRSTCWLLWHIWWVSDSVVAQPGSCSLLTSIPLVIYVFKYHFLLIFYYNITVLCYPHIEYLPLCYVFLEWGDLYSFDKFNWRSISLRQGHI